MRNFKPIFSLAATQEPQARLRSKFGGRPWGLAQSVWPKNMALLAQLVHEPPMIDLGGDYVLHIWHWNSPEDYLDPPNYDFYCHFSTLVPRSELGNELTPAPKGQKLIGEVYIERWEAFDDNAPDEWLPMFLDKETYSQLLEREIGKIHYGGGLRTKFGGPPCWKGTNAIENAPKSCDFLFQTNAYMPIEGEPPTKEIIQKHKLNGIVPSRKANEYIFVITDFACDGSAFVFMDKKQDPPLPLWTWSR